jgi:hypothetical protein
LSAIEARQSSLEVRFTDLESRFSDMKADMARFHEEFEKRLEDLQKRLSGIGFTKLFFGRKRFWLFFHPQIMDRFPPENNVHKFT